MNQSLTAEERVWAVLSHLSALAFGMGILLPILGWSEQRRKSKYASFQCLQALGYQSLGFTIWMFSTLLLLIGLLVIAFLSSLLAVKYGRTFDALGGLTLILVIIVVFGFVAFYMLLPILAAVRCGFGKSFRYPMMGTRLAKYLGYEQGNEPEWLHEQHESQWIVAMGHFSVVIVLWGLTVPFALWITQAKRNLYLRFQSIQTLVYQAVATILYFLAMFIVLLGTSALILTVGIDQGTGSNPLLGIGIFFVFSVIGSLLLLVLPLFHILGQWAGYRVLKGDNYHYPVIGKLIERWIANKTPLAADSGLSLKGNSL